MRWPPPALGLVLACALLAAPVPQAAAPEGTAAQDLRAAVAGLTEVLGDAGAMRQSELAALVADWIDPMPLTQAAFGEYVRRALQSYDNVLSKRDLRLLSQQHMERLSRALHQRLLSDLHTVLAKHSIRAVHVQDLRLEGERGYLELLLLAPGVQFEARVQLRRGDGGWRLVELTAHGQTLRRHYQDLFAEVLDKHYSPPALEAALLGRPYIVLEDFAGTPPGQLPLDWGSWRDKDKDKPLLYHVAVEGGQPYLAAADSGQSVILGKFAHWDARQYPIMTWCWRAHVLPAGGNESQDDTNDSAAGLYVIFSQNWLGVPKQLKYVWSTTVPEGSVGRRNLLFRPWFFVLESGEHNLGRWVFEQVDLADHHESRLGGRLPDRTIGLGLLTDANSTGTYAAADYADLRVWTRAAHQAGLVQDYCECRNQPPRSPRP